MGNSNHKKPIFQKWWFWVIIVIAILAIIGAIVGSQFGGSTQTDAVSSVPSKTTSSSVTAIEVDATKLVEAYDNNQVAADSDYKGKNLKITGTVKSIGVDVADRAYMMLADERNEYAVLGVQCYFNKDNKDSLSTLKEGDVVTVTGTCEGKVVSVSIKNCTINS